MSEKKRVIPGVELEHHNMGGVNRTVDKTEHPYLMELICRVPGFMDFAATAIFGREEVRVRAKTLEGLNEFIAANDFRNHPRLTKMTITGPQGQIEEYTNEMRLTAINKRLAESAAAK